MLNIVHLSLHMCDRRNMWISGLARIIEWFVYFVSETDVYSFTCTSIVAYALSCVKIQSNIFLWHSFLEAIITYKKGIELIALQVFTYHFIIDYIPSNIITVWSTASFSDLRLVIVEVEVMEERHMRWCAFFLATEAPMSTDSHTEPFSGIHTGR